jgi:CheY-specific phosphatase CheX
MNDIEIKVKELVRFVTLQGLKEHTQNIEVSINEIPGVDHHQMLAPWMGLILISGPSLRITMKCHYTSDNGKFFAQKVMGKKSSEISFSQVQDFIREYCNLCGGKVKKIFSDSNLDTGISLPLALRGFDELFFYDKKTLDTPGYSQDYWSLECENHFFILSSIIEIYNVSDINKLAVDFNTASSGDIDYL